MPSKVSVRKVPGQKKETAADKRRRIASNKKAKEIAFNYIIPGIILILLGVAALFFYLYGFGGIQKKLLQTK
jgi:hypothetical protein